MALIQSKKGRHMIKLFIGHNLNYNTKSFDASIYLGLHCLQETDRVPDHQRTSLKIANTIKARITTT